MEPDGSADYGRISRCMVKTRTVIDRHSKVNHDSWVWTYVAYKRFVAGCQGQRSLNKMDVSSFALKCEEGQKERHVLCNKNVSACECT